MGNCSNNAKVMNDVQADAHVKGNGKVESKQQTIEIAESTVRKSEETTVKERYDQDEDVSDIYTEDSETDGSNSDAYYEDIDSENDYEYIEVSEYEVTDSEMDTKSVTSEKGGPNNRLKIGAMGLIAKQKWQKKSQLSEVVEDTEVNEELESKSPTKVVPSSVEYDMNSIINAKIVTKRWKRKIKASPPADPPVRRDSSLIGVFSAINVSKKWKNKVNQRHEETWDAVSTQNVTKRWKKKLKHVRLKIKKKDQESENMNAAQVTHKWKSQMKRSKEMKSGEECAGEAENGEVTGEPGVAAAGDGEQKQRKVHRRRRSIKEREGAEITQSIDMIKMTRNWRKQSLKKPIEEEAED